LSASLFLICSLQGQQPPNTSRQPYDFFARPEALCSALQVAGIETGPWQQIGAGFFNGQIERLRSPYACQNSMPAASLAASSPVLAEAMHVPPPALAVVYRVSGDVEKRADIITIAVTTRPESVRSGEQELERLVALLFKYINRPEPAGLVPSIDRHRYFRSRQPYGKISFSLVTPTRKPNERVLWFRLWE
jgi:hypothetical protein